MEFIVNVIGNALLAGAAAWVGYYFGRRAARKEMEAVSTLLDGAISTANEIRQQCDKMLK